MHLYVIFMKKKEINGGIDLDLRIIAPDNTVIRTSLSSNNSVENIEFGAMQTGNYTIVVNKVPNSYTGNVEYGLAWMEA